MESFLIFEKLSANADKYDMFYKKLVEDNEKFNLTSITGFEETAYKHFIDSVYYKDIFEKDKTVVEIGSGAGFPSVPLAIERPDLKFTLIEANNKKCNFLNEVKDELGLNNVTVVWSRAEAAVKNNLRDSFDYAIARAVAPINTLLEYSLPFLKVNGNAVFWKGEGYKEELENARNALSVLGGKTEKILDYSLGEYGERFLVIINKVKDTPVKYPRGKGKERKCPL